MEVSGQLYAPAVLPPGKEPPVRIGEKAGFSSSVLENDVIVGYFQKHYDDFVLYLSSYGTSGATGVTRIRSKTLNHIYIHSSCISEFKSQNCI
jgi:hypothetical protein